MTVPTSSRPDKEILTSRLLAALAAACLLAVGVVRVLDLGQVKVAHPSHWVIAVVCCLLGVRIVAHERRNAVGWLLLAMGLCAALAVGAQAWPASFLSAWLGTWVWWPSYALLPVTTLIFPEGRLQSARWWPVLVIGGLGVVLPIVGIGWAAWAAPATFFSDIVRGTATRGLPMLLTLAGVLCAFVGMLGSLLSLVFRWRRADQNQRRLRLWTAGLTAVLIPVWLFDFLGTTWGVWVFAAAFPAVVVVAILRQGLYDITLLIHRSLLYGLLAVSLVLAYIAVALIFTTTLPTQADAVSTVAVVLLLAPLHRRLRGVVDRWLYGDRDDPYRALSRLGEQLALAMPPQQALFEVARTIGEALKLPYVAIQEGPPPGSRQLATYGQSHDWPQISIPLEQDGATVSTLVVEVRAPDEQLSRRERLLLDDLGRQVALAVRSARLAEDLRRAGEEREEDLVHVTTELHDAVGPSVAGIRLQADALRKSLDRTQTRAIAKLDQIVEDLCTVSTEVRDLSRNVRPPALEHGLLHAVRARAEQFEQSTFTVSVTPVGALEGLPDGVERAAYRIVGEALTNVERYANASSCQVRLARSTSGLEVSVADDGNGIAPWAVFGNGLYSMRRRCESRGGRFRIESLAKGTRVVAYLPFGEPVIAVSSS